jgi:RHS repeat-associated protein
MQTDKLFTGQRAMAGLGIYHYNARFYSPKLGRFLSADTIVPNPYNPQHLNRFSYVTNNPLKYIDPSGHRPCEDYQGSCLSEKQVTKIWNAKVQKPKKDFGLKFEGKGAPNDQEAFEEAVSQEASKMYHVYCRQQVTRFDGGCGFESPEDLYVATHGTTVITWSNTSVTGYYCERNANVGAEGVSCYANSRGNITPVIAAHEMGHVFNALIANNGQITPYTDMGNEHASNLDFPAPNADIAQGHLQNDVPPHGEEYANMHSMWIFGDWPSSTGGRERRQFMDDHMYTWISRLLYP